MKTILLFFFLNCFLAFGQSFEKKSFYLTANASSLIPGKKSYFSYKKFHGLGANQVLSLEPEIGLNKKLSIKLELGIGLGFVKEGTETNEKIRYHSQHTSNCYLCVSGHGENTSYLSPIARRNDLIFHVGISPKYYLSRGKHAAIFVQPTFRIGLMDKYAISTFVKQTVEPGNSPYPPPAPPVYIINELERSNFYKSNPYLFFRGELTLGAELNISDRFSIIPQIGLATMSMSKGDLPDEYYVSENGGEYVRMGTIHENTDVGFSGIKFGKIASDFHWYKRSRVQTILRLSARFQLTCGGNGDF